MQLERRARGRRRIAAACTALLGLAPRAADAAEVNSSTLYYSETDRVTALETRVSYGTDVREGGRLTLRFSFDALTGASANGTPASPVPQTFTRPSGAGSYHVAPGVTPLDDTFHDTRADFGASLLWPLGRLARGTVGATFSGEFDYQSTSFDLRLARDFFQRNTTVQIGGSLSFDSISPQGGPPVPFATMQPAGRAQPKERGTRNKDTVDLLFGVTQVIDRHTITQVNYSRSRADGYLTDPYKLLAVVQGADGAEPGLPVRYVYENRPDRRTRESVFTETRRALGRDVVRANYRYLWDDWGVRSHTAEARYRKELGTRNAVEPQVRFYRQTGAEFQVHSLTDGEPLPEFASGDYRLGDYDAWTLAAKWEHRLLSGKTLGFRVGRYRQAGTPRGPTPVGALAQQDLFPTVTAWLSQFSIGWAW